MLLLKTLESKSQITSNNEKIIDLTENTFKYNTNVDAIASVIVTDDFEMRSDLLARAYYGNSNKMDYILKYNGISNPFSIEKGMILLIPDQNAMDANFVPSKSENAEEKKEDIRKRFFDETRLSKKDAKRLELIKKKAENTVLTPNMAEIGSKEITVKDGMVVFGNDVVFNKDSCPVPQSRASVKAKLIAKKIFKNVK